MDVKSIICLGLLSILMVGCSDSPENSEPDYPALEARFRANVSGDSDKVAIAATIRNRGERVQMVGGDLFVARSGVETITLKNVDDQSGDYVGELSLLPGEQHVDIEIIHDVLEASEGRWYPIDILQVDPGKGEYVGQSGKVLIPQSGINITQPATKTRYTDKGQEIEIRWDIPENSTGELYSARIAAFSKCYDGDRTRKHYFEKAFTDDSGVAPIMVDDVVYTTKVDRPIEYIFQTVFDLLVGLTLEAMTFGAYDAEDSLPFTSEHCDIDILVFRELRGDLSNDFDGGFAVGSRSDQVRVEYRP